MKHNLHKTITIINNGQLSRKETVILKCHNISKSLLDILWDEGFILGYQVYKFNELKVFLKYKQIGTPIINMIKSISSPGQRVYYTLKQIWKIDSSKTLIIFSTSQGLKSIKECKRLKIGGEPILSIN